VAKIYAEVGIAPFLLNSAILYSRQLSEPINAVCHQVLLRTTQISVLTFMKIALIITLRYKDENVLCLIKIHVNPLEHVIAFTGKNFCEMKK
jgi:hypothetical protein